MIADYGATGMTVGTHPLALLRSKLDEQNITPSDQLIKLEENTLVKVSGLVVARQRPGTAKGVVFVLLEDEVGVINVILPPKIYEQHRVTVRSEPLLTITGRVERRTGALNVLATNVAALFGEEVAAQIREIQKPQNGDFSAARKVMDEAADIRAVAPVGINFGRRGR